MTNSFLLVLKHGPTGVPINISKQTLATRFSLHPSVLPVIGYGWHIPPLTLNFSSIGTVLSFPSCLSLDNPAILIIWPFGLAFILSASLLAQAAPLG